MEAIVMQCVEIDQAAACFPDLINKTVEGDMIIITRSGKPLVKFVAIPNTKKKRRKRVFGSAKGLIKMSPDFDDPLEDFKEYM
jgi:antitoxin (DNA-binding transcriptional repressor) of toxin-antitoxin stability system